jgi:hypothetical protein
MIVEKIVIMIQGIKAKTGQNPPVHSDGVK